jgi:hypothetical protein
MTRAFNLLARTLRREAPPRMPALRRDEQAALLGTDRKQVL